MNLDDAEHLFTITKSDIMCNTSYPLKKEYFTMYRSSADIMDGVDSLSLYYHIPFCSHLCKFCEYTRFLSGDYKSEMEYILKLKEQALNYISSHSVKLLYGMDIGGGTPTALHIDAFRELLDFTGEIRESCEQVSDFESSMEFSFSTITSEKIDCIASSGIQRLSTGIQIYDKGILKENDRKMDSVSKMKKIMSEIRNKGIKKINLDIMYGFNEQTELMLKNTIDVIEMMQPEQVTLYEMRYNLNRLKHDTIDRDILFEQYCYLYDSLIQLGYHAEFGRNTFSIYDDEGVSSYLRYRMFYGIPYKGFGISAQSMSKNGISYNIFKSYNSKSIPQFHNIIEEDIYLLPKEEIAAKYVCVSLYSGQFSLKVLSGILETDAEKYYCNEIEYLTNNNLICIKDRDVCRLTREGFRLYGAVASLFWSDYHKRSYLSEKV